MFKPLKQQRGDTIVEVLIAIAVVSMVLAASYATMNSNLLILRDNQERTEAAKLAQGQVEALKQAWNTTDGKADVTAARSGTFCMSGGAAQSTGAGTMTPDLNADNLTGYSPGCVSSYYSLGIRYNSGTYTIMARWTQAGGKGRGQVVMAYRLE